MLNGKSRNTIYSITCLINQKRYIGQTVNWHHRKIQHLSALRRDQHHNKHLQRAWNKYGEENFEFELIENDCLDINESEKKWIVFYNTVNTERGYNMNPGGCDSSSREHYRPLMIFDSKTGRLVSQFKTSRECADFLGCHTSSIFSALQTPLKSAKGHYIRDFVEGISSLDVKKLKEELRASKKRAGLLGNQHKKRLKNKLPDRLLAVEELLPMITGEIDEDNVQNHGIDLNVVQIRKLLGAGYIPKKGKTILPTYEEIELNENNQWILAPGAYDVTFKQGCNIPSYVMLLIRQRSSLLRCGGLISSSIWDAGFKTEKMGTVMILNKPITIEFDARIACIYGHACIPVSKLYDGQWQLDEWRKLLKETVA